MCTYMCEYTYLWVGMHMGAFACRGQRLTGHVFFTHSSPYVFRQGLSLEPSASWYGWSSYPAHLRKHPSPTLPILGSQADPHACPAFIWVQGIPNSSPQAYVASTFTHWVIYDPILHYWFFLFVCFRILDILYLNCTSKSTCFTVQLQLKKTITGIELSRWHNNV